jgi:aminoglycoside phosphotransferase (APT) family kinase protein
MTDWRHLFDTLGHPDSQPLGAGMEGVVHRLGDGLVGKAWFHRTATDLEPLRAFQAELAAQRLQFATPEIVRIHERAGRAVTVERELPGTPLTTAVEAGVVPAATAEDAVVAVVAALRDTEAGPAARALPVLGEATSPRAGHRTWQAALAALVLRRATIHHDVLAAAVPDVDTVVRRVVSLLDGIAPTAPDRVVHGDICQENILVDGDGVPVSVLDWGFLTMAGDNAYDASTAAGFHDMYGPDARDHDDVLLGRFERVLGLDRDRLLLYRAAYAVLGANAYSPTGTDGHFAWCVAMLGREDVRAALHTRR